MIIDADHGDANEPIVTLRMTKKQAEWLRDGAADISCWISGFKAGLGPDRQSDAPLGHEEVRELNIALRKAIEAAE
jgi:hypothetical protein